MNLKERFVEFKKIRNKTRKEQVLWKKYDLKKDGKIELKGWKVMDEGRIKWSSLKVHTHGCTYWNVQPLSTPMAAMLFLLFFFGIFFPRVVTRE